MDNELDYKNAVVYIGDTETIQTQQSTVIDINEVFASRLDIRSLSTTDVNSLLDKLDLKKTETSVHPPMWPKAQAPEQAAQQGEELGEERENAARALGGIVKKIGKEFEESVSKEIKKAEAYVQPTARQGEQLGEERENAVRAFGGIVKKIGKEFEESVSKEIKQVGAEKLVLPRLSLPDQIRDLKIIDEGIDEGIFDAEQMGVINAEIRSLYSAIVSEKPIGMDVDQMTLKQIRDNLCKDVFDKLNFGQGASAA